MKNISIYMLLLLIMVASCKKDKGETPPLDITGTWRVADNSMTKVAYYHFTADKHLYKLNRDSEGWKGLSKGLYQFGDGQLITSFPPITPGGSISSVLYNITEGKDTITLEPGMFNGDKIVLIKDNLAPKSVQDFITPVQPLTFFEDTAKVQSLTYYNSKLYGVKSSDKLMVYGIAEKRVTEIRAMNTYYNGVEFDHNGNFWAAGYANKFYKVDPVTGNLLFTSSDSEGFFRTVTFDGIYWLGASTANGNLYKYYEPNDNYEGSYQGHYKIDELGYGANHGYAIQGGVIHRFTNSFFTYDKAYYIEGYRCKSIAYDRNTDVFWVGAEDMATGKYYMLQVQLN